MNSCLYEVKIMHERREPRVHFFEHSVFMFYLDLTEVDAIARQIPLFGHNQRRVYDYRESDHIGDVRAYLNEKGIDHRVKSIRCLTNVRTFGYIFNPVTFYFCFDADEQPLCTVVEIGNTFGELKYFFLGPETRQDGAFDDRQTKYYYISPFTDLDHTLHFHAQVPGEHLKIDIDVLNKERRYFFSTMMGTRKDLTLKNLAWHTLKYPFITLKVIFLIHWHAALLHFVKKVPHHPKEDNMDLQRGRARPWPKEPS